ncbi:MAG: NADH-quinone oxidoreductase subunit C [Rickettsiales bacterium]|nr:NADH-quinone oxidoreductase subunit C [Rickettsiales bacterium]
MFQNLELQANYIKEKFPDLEVISPIANNNLIIYSPKDKIVDLATFLRDEESLSFKVLLDVFGADMLTIRSPRFEVIYNFLSLKLNNRITIKVAVDENIEVPSLCSVFPSANWFERETFDMFGIKFTNHPDLRRILTDYNFEWHPLKKDFPLTGYQEVRYDEIKQKVVYEPVKLSQEFRNFDFDMPWFGPQQKK